MHAKDAHAVDADIRSADIALIEAEVEFRVEAKLKRVQAEGEQLRASDVPRMETEAAERKARAALAGSSSRYAGKIDEILALTIVAPQMV